MPINLKTQMVANFLHGNEDENTSIKCKQVLMVAAIFFFLLMAILITVANSFFYLVRKNDDPITSFLVSFFLDETRPFYFL